MRFTQVAGRSIRVGCGSGFWGDSRLSTKQLVDHGNLDYLVYDYLSEITMSLMTAARMKKPEMGYAPDIIPSLTPHFDALRARGTKVVCNAGGVNPEGCAEALAKAAEKKGVKDLKIAAIGGDQIFESGIVSANAYFGAQSVVEALKQGAEVILTGRLTDSALILGPAVHEFGWAWNDWDKLAAGSCAGHIVECGAQCTGGNHTDWRNVSDSWWNIGFPIAEINDDGSFLVTKAPGTGGKVAFGPVAEQLTYEVGNPAAYILPDVVADFSEVKIEELDEDLVKVTGVTGHPPTDSLKLGKTKLNGFRSMFACYVGGRDPQEKAMATGKALLKRIEDELIKRGHEPFTETLLHCTPPVGVSTPECVMRMTVRHTDRDALKFFGVELATAGTSMAPGLQGVVGGRPRPFPVLEYESVLIEKTEITPTLTIDGEDIEVPNFTDYEPTKEMPMPREQADATKEGKFSYEVMDLALCRSGDKGNSSNVSVIARKPEYLPYLRKHLTEEVVYNYLSNIYPNSFTGGVESVKRYDWPGINGFNFYLGESLGGGGVASIQTDPQGKAYGSHLTLYKMNNLPHISEM